MDTTVSRDALPVSVSPIGRSVSTSTQPPSMSLDNISERSRYHSSSPISNSESIEVSGNDELDLEPAVKNPHSIFGTHSPVSDPKYKSRLQSTIFEPHPLQSSVESEDRSGVTELSEQKILKQDLTLGSNEHYLSAYDGVFVPKRHPKLSRESSRSSVSNRAYACVTRPKQTAMRTAFSRDAGSPKRSSQTGSNPSAFAALGSPDGTDVDEPFPRLLRTLTAHPMTDMTERDSNFDGEDEDAITSEELSAWLQSHTGRDTAFDRLGLLRTPSAQLRVQRRNSSIAHPLYILEDYHYNGMTLRRDVDVELRDTSFAEGGEAHKGQSGPHNSFMRVVNIIRDTRNHDVTIRGWVFQRAQYLNGILEKKKNEVCWVMRIDEDDDRDMKTQSMETVGVEKIIRCRTIRLTNQPFPKLSFREEHVPGDSEEMVRNERSLVCRFMFINQYVSAERRESNYWSERSIRRLRRVDCDDWTSPKGESCAADDKHVRRAWRGQTFPGGSFLLSRRTITEQPKQDSELGLTAPDLAQSPGRTSISSRSDYSVTSSTANHTNVGSTTLKRGADTDSTSRPFKRSRHEPSQVQIVLPPHTVSMLTLLKRQHPNEESASWDSIPRPHITVGLL